MLLDHARITPLHFAAQNNSLDVVPILMQAGADPHAQVNPEGYTPLHLAKLFKHREMIAMLHFYSRRIY
ncbi:MAG: ankyrin repeat domain-containing protein [Coxiellaceae bacterium]|nr:MAG: ankyrin repeat domain-containing protein [Coxiellaceae bacterium]